MAASFMGFLEVVDVLLKHNAQVDLRTSVSIA